MEKFEVYYIDVESAGSPAVRGRVSIPGEGDQVSPE
jgi:hypothetical protein